MFDNKKIKNIDVYSFPQSKFIEYEESDLRWAKYGYANLIINRTEVLFNDMVQSEHNSPTNQPNLGGQIIENLRSVQSTTYRNPNSTWKPKWNPVLIG